MTGLADYLALHAKLQPDRLAVADLASGRRWPYAAFDRSVGACARLLTGHYALTPGDRVACLGKNRAEILMLHLACARTGLVFVPINWRLSPAEVGQLIEDAEPSLVFGDGELETAGVSGVTLNRLAEQIDAAELLVLTEADPDRASLILYTSGTSGRPKGAVLSERNLAQTAINFGVLGQVTPQSVFLIDSPMFHIIGLVTSVRPALMFGGAMLISDGFQPARTLQRLADPALGVTHYFCVPQMAAALRSQSSFDPDRLRGLTAVFTGGAPHPAEDILAWVDRGVPIVDGFGMSEAGTVFGMPIGLDQLRAKAGCVGQPTPLVRARIVDAAGEDCPSGVAGELLLKGDNIFQGYWRRPAETEASFTEDGWFRTGDIATRDADGFYRLVDRKKDMFISGGENVYPAEIEAALAGLPGLVECAVVGVADQRWGEVGVCVFVTADDAGLRDSHLLDHLSPRLARYKLPRRFVSIDRLPRTGSGKILKTELLAWLRDRAE